MKQHKITRKTFSLRTVTRLPALVALSLVIMAAVIVPHVTADTYDEQIKALQQENSSNRNIVSDLENQAASYQDAINRLQAQISQLQAQINDNVAKQTDLQQKIDENQRELDHQREVLGENIKVMYVEGQVTTIEMLATSKNLSDFVDKEEYRNAVERKIQDTLKRITTLQNEQKEQKVQLERLLDEQKTQQSQVAQAKTEQSKLLNYNQSQQAAYNQKTKDNQSKIAELRKQQAAENARLFAGNGSHIIAGNNGNDTYPNKWRNAAQDSLVDSWGMFNRECVSYTAWKVYESGRYMPYWGGHGNANLWDDNARADGIPVDTNPRVGDVAIKNSQPYGHAMYVEHVYDDGSIYISQYNQDLTGHYSEAIISGTTVRSMNLQFIHFQ